MINLILNLLEKLPYRSKFGLNLADVLKVRYYHSYGEKRHRCLCGGKVITWGVGRDGWETACRECEFVYDED
jgi:hypothetical protein